MSMDDDVVRPMPPRRPQRSSVGTRYRRWRNRIIGVLVPLVLVVGGLLRFWTDLMWFDEVGQRDVMVTRLQWGTAMGIGFGLFTFFVLYVNFSIARRVARDDLYVPFLAVRSDPEAPEQPVIPHFVLKPILLGVAAAAAVIAGLVMGSRWEVVLRFLGRTDFNVTDPQFGKDASFYVFTMPLLELITRSLQVLIIVAGIGVVLAYVATGVIRYTPVPRAARGAIVHVSWLVAAFLVVSALNYRLSIWSLATSTRGYVAGAGWTDVHARIPAYWLMAVASLVLAVVVVLYARREKWRVVGGAVVGWFIASTIVTGIIPGVVQRVLVSPNEQQREAKVISGNIRNTRFAFGLDDIDTKPFTDQAALDRRALLEGNLPTTDNLRLWSPEPLRDVLNQDQNVRQFYEFTDSDVDRYQLGDEYRQVMVSVRELDPRATAIASGWTNEHLSYTHGYGAVATLPNEVDSDGKPRHILRDLSMKTTGEGEALKVDRPEIYYGENGNDYVFVGTKTREISGADEDDGSARDTEYTGTGGIKITSLARRIAFAATFRDTRVLFTGQFDKDSKVMFRRRISERVHELAPFLTLDRDPYAVIVDGRVKWIVDAYATSDRFPYSQAAPLGQAVADARGVPTTTDVNYVRNSVKAVVDAYDGSVKLYVIDDEDPIVSSWRDIFPKLFTDGDKLPEQLRAHLRYPEDLFEAQTETFKRYHMTDVADFYGRKDEWDVASIESKPMDAFYVLAKLPGEAREEQLLIRPLTPRGRKNMLAYMVARSDGEAYGEVRTLRLSTSQSTQGPSQIQARINQDSEISPQLREWRTGSNKVVFGDLLVLPVEQSLLYAQPIYLVNAEASIPEFQRIVLALGSTIAWGSSYSRAAEALLRERAADLEEDGGAEDGGGDAGSGDDGGDAPSGDAGSDDGAASGEDSDTGSAGTGGKVPAPATGDFTGLSQAELATLVAKVAAAYDRADACQQQGDTVCFAREIEQVERLLADARR
ncbi:MAG: hypothetical protein JWM86_1186 [Thermoleophilia bacterium]|nr:hypothetical protein [Thermoleophilia bacterium]